MKINLNIVRATLLLIVLSIISSSCTVYHHNLKNKDGLGISSQDLDNLAIGDKVRIRLKKGSEVVGELIEQNDKSINLKHVEATKTNSIIMFDQIASISYKKDAETTAIRSVNTVALIAIPLGILIWLSTSLF